MMRTMNPGQRASTKAGFIGTPLPILGVLEISLEGSHITGDEKQNQGPSRVVGWDGDPYLSQYF